MIDKKSLICWTFVTGIFFTFLAIFYKQFGIAQIVFITFYLSFCISLYWGFTKISNIFSAYAEDKTVNPKGRLKPKNIIRIKIGFGVLFTILIIDPLTIVFTVIHEVAHATTALAFGIHVLKITITDPGRGYTELPPNSNNSLVAIAGSLSVIVSAIILLVLIYQSKTVKLDVFIAIFFSIWYSILESVKYWHDSIFKKVGDAWDFLSFNPQIDPLWLAHLCLIIQTGFIVFLLFVFFSKIAGYFKYYFPDVSFGKFERLVR